MEKKFSWGCQKYLHAFQQLWTNIGKYLSQSDFSLTRVNIQRKPSVTNWIKSNFMGNSLKKKKTNYSFDILHFLTLDEYFPILLSFNVLLVLAADNLQWHWMTKLLPMIHDDSKIKSWIAIVILSGGGVSRGGCDGRTLTGLQENWKLHANYQRPHLWRRKRFWKNISCNMYMGQFPSNFRQSWKKINLWRCKICVMALEVMLLSWQLKRPSWREGNFLFQSSVRKQI